MVNMSKRFADEESNSSSDEDDGNFKRRRRHSDEDTFVSRTLKLFEAPEVSKPLKVFDSQEGKQLIQKQRVLNEKLTHLPKYDDLFDNPSEDCLQSTAVNDCEETVDCAVTSCSLSETNAQITSTTIEITSDSDPTDVLAGGDTEEVSNTNDPRLRRMLRFKSDPTEVPPLGGPALLHKVNQLLNSRKPFEAYNRLKGEITPLELHKYTDFLMVMAKDWFPSQIDTAYDPRSVFIEVTNLNAFSNLLKDIFSVKVKSKEFWESVINSTEKFINESKIKELPQLLTKIRWILIKDIRDYLVSEEVKIGMKVSAILLDHKIQLESNRMKHRRQFEATVAAHMPRLPQRVTEIIDISSNTATPPVPVILNSADPRCKPRPKEDFDNHIISPFQSTPSPFPSIENQSERRIVSQIFVCLGSDQIFKLIDMLKRHTRTQPYTFIENIGQALRQLIEREPKRSVFTIYQKLHDTLLLNIKDFKSSGSDERRVDIIFEKLLKEFQETVIYNPKEWLLIRDHTRTEKFNKHFQLKDNPFNETFIPIHHNIVIDCGYISNGLTINYSAIEEDIPLMAQNIMLKDPRIELKSDPLINSLEVISFDDSVVGKFSPDRSDSSPSTSPEYNFSGMSVPSTDSNNEVNSDANSDIICEDRPNQLSPEPQTSIEVPLNEETVPQKTENANPIQNVLQTKSKAVKICFKKVSPLTNKSNNKTLLKKKVIHTKTKLKTIKSSNSGSKLQNAIKMSATKPKVSAAANNESPVKPQPKTASTSAIISPKSLTVVNSVCNNMVTTVANRSDTPQNRIIKLSKGKYNEAELKKIIRRVSISSDESDG